MILGTLLSNTVLNKSKIVVTVLTKNAQPEFLDLAMCESIYLPLSGIDSIDCFNPMVSNKIFTQFLIALIKPSGLIVGLLLF